MDKISARDLRIGNWLHHTWYKRPSQVNASAILSIEQGSNNYSPIPLTPELLERCGFVKDGDFDNHSIDYYRKGCIHIQFPNYEDWDICYVWRDNVIDEKGMRKQYDIVLKSLHQLQNLYYALTTIELDVKM